MMYMIINKYPKKNILAILNKEGREIYGFDEIVKLSGLDRKHVWYILSRLKNKGRLIRLEKGKYLYVPEGFEGNWTGNSYLIASNLIKPYAIAYWSALNYWHYTEQIPSTIFIQSVKRKLHKTKNIFGVEYKLITVGKSNFFGLTTIWENHRKIKITDKEKTIIDCLDYPEYCGGLSELIKGVQYGFKNKELNVRKLINYAGRISNRTVMKRLGYILEKSKIRLSEKLINKIRNKISEGYSLLDPTMPNTGKLN